MKEIFVLILIGSVLIVAQNQPVGVVCNENIANCITKEVLNSGSPGIQRCGCVKCKDKHYLVISNYTFFEGYDPANVIEIPLIGKSILWGTKCVEFCKNNEDSEVNT